jgi:hypothetical protein
MINKQVVGFGLLGIGFNTKPQMTKDRQQATIESEIL